MDFNFINEHIPLYVEAAKLTLIMAFWGISLAIVVGLIVSLIRYFKVPVLDKIVGFYIADMWNRRIDISWRKLYGRGF